MLKKINGLKSKFKCWIQRKYSCFQMRMIHRKKKTPWWLVLQIEPGTGTNTILSQQHHQKNTKYTFKEWNDPIIFEQFNICYFLFSFVLNQLNVIHSCAAFLMIFMWCPCRNIPTSYSYGLAGTRSAHGEAVFSPQNSSSYDYVWSCNNFSALCLG